MYVHERRHAVPLDRVRSPAAESCYGHPAVHLSKLSEAFRRYAPSVSACNQPNVPALRQHKCGAHRESSDGHAREELSTATVVEQIGFNGPCIFRDVHVPAMMIALSASTPGVTAAPFNATVELSVDDCAGGRRRA